MERALVAPSLGQDRAFLCLSRRCSTDPLQHERYLGDERQAPQRRLGPGPFPDRRGCIDADVSGLAQDREGMDHAAA